MRAYLYARISKDATGEGLGVERQEQDCRELATSLGWEILETFVDNDVSASSGRARPAYGKMLAGIERGEADAIIAWHADRLYRRPQDLEKLIEVCERYRIAIRTVRAGEIDLSTPTGRMVARILGSVARQEVEAKSDRWERSRRQRRENGTPPPSRARLFGYARDGMTVVEEEAETARWMAAQVLAGVPVARICRQLHERGVVTTLGNPWRPNTLRNYLGNPRLAGLTRWQGEIVGEGTFPAILKRGTWERVQALLVARKRTTPTARVSLLNGLVFCGVCDARLHTGNRGDGMRIYRCTRAAPPYTGCGKVSVLAEPVEDRIEGACERILADPATRRALASRQADGDTSALVASIDADRVRLRELEAALVEGGAAVGALTRAISEVQERIEATRGRLAEESADQIDWEATAETWPVALEQRRKIVERLVERVTIMPSRGGNRFDLDRVKIKETVARG